MALFLLADDDDIVGELVRETFAEYGHAVGVVTNGRDALRAMRAKRPDLVIMDCNMPELSGLLALREMRQSPDLYTLPVLMLTARQGRTDEELAMHEGANGYMKKPFDPHTLVFRAEEMLGNGGR